MSDPWFTALLIGGCVFYAISLLVVYLLGYRQALRNGEKATNDDEARWRAPEALVRCGLCGDEVMSPDLHFTGGYTYDGDRLYGAECPGPSDFAEPAVVPSQPHQHPQGDSR